MPVDNNVCSNFTHEKQFALVFGFDGLIENILLFL